ncbi:hypothetical protein R1T16_04715 [Flavobacterium sp. DG1-102-2]|uniref:hypothetical protein n=1 Tax=Flavobacterium sp. DG1-102-2 TaxID=3081663 RepID=UPI002949606A|nr:hypothetical protein [Flavobacterium sp. DG1-102-2]MDV6167715.1 hypothetical protein [Flavobacterium sp. DG1-102-2]
MEKLTQEQITAVDKALWDIGIKYLDIRIEMTDHAAATIESMEGSFERRLKKYIFENKKELKKNYRQFSMNASIKAVKLLISNMFTVRFFMILASVYALLFAEYKYEEFEDATNIFLIICCVSISVFWICWGIINFTRSTELFSTAERLLMRVNGIIFLMAFPLRDIIDKLEINDAVKLLYYAFVISFYIAIWFTYSFLTKFYKSRYRVV